MFVWTEGRSDWKHLSSALRSLQSQGKIREINVQFLGKEDDRGSDELSKMCEYYARTKHNEPHIFIFDRDETKILKKILANEGPYKSWGNNVFSFAIPIPSHRRETPEICIELYYTDSEIMVPDKNGRRLYLSNEFSEKSGKLINDRTINCIGLHKLRAGKLKIISADDYVFDENDNNIALSKNDFAEYIYNKVDNFDKFDFSEFEAIFDIIESIAKV